MPEFVPTPSQKAAITTKGRAVLVSAAAGSGKTKVLTERLLARIREDADIDSFLVITFTKAAAAELKGRITKEISAHLADEPDNRRLRRQSALVQKAHIGTIHSFCAALLREQCHLAQLSPDFKVIEDDRASLLRRRVCERVLDEAYEKADPDFLRLSDTVGRGRDDRRLSELLLSVYDKLQSHARPVDWAQRQAEALAPDVKDAGETKWGREILSRLREDAEYRVRCLEKLYDMCRCEDSLRKSYGEKLLITIDSLREFIKATDIGWDAARGCLPIAMPSFTGARKTENPETLETVKNIRKSCKEGIEKYASLLNAPSDALLSELAETKPVMTAFAALLKDFDKAYSTEKRRRAELDFSDLEHLTLSLLLDDKGERTPLAEELSERFTEIMVDEYQDVNAVQDAIFRALSKNGSNLFMVGDVKQSIYRFRLADPTIFTEKYRRYKDLDDAGEGEPVRIMLRENFRSRQEIIDAANHVFSVCMSEKLGDMSYDENARLCCGAPYEGRVPAPELILVDKDSDDADRSELEAAAVADKIQELMQSGVTVTDGGVERPLRYGDIALLMRSANSVGEAYRRILSMRGIPTESGKGSDFFAAPEVSMLMCLLAVIDNPHQDIPLISVLRSPAFGFSADELTEIRACDKTADFCTALEKRAEDNDKCAAFLAKLRVMRSFSRDTELCELLRRVYAETDLPALCSAMPDGERRCARLYRLLRLAERFEATGYKGLHRFVGWLGELAENGAEQEAGDGGDGVKLMTVHKSKGLEFPVVFLCDTARLFNRSDTRGTLLLHHELGFGPRYIDTERGIEYPTLAHVALRLRLDREMLSEELRLLYVALTRARERLFMTAAVKEPEETLQKLAAGTLYPVSPEALLGATNPALWLMQSLLSDKKSRLSLAIARPWITCRGEDGEESVPAPKAAPDPALAERIRRQLAFSYPHPMAQRLPSKVTATELKKLEEPDFEALSLAPAPVLTFRLPELQRAEKAPVGAEKGIATHTLLQYIDYAKTQSPEEINAEVLRLCAEGRLTQRQAGAVEPQCIQRLFASPLGRRIRNADAVLREFKFSLLCPAEDYFPGGEGEKLLLQGVIDCCIEEDGELTIIDYKTDRVTGTALDARAKLYESQVKAYASAAQRMTGKPVKECVLYFLYAGKELRV